MARCSRDSPRANPRPMCPDQARGKKMRQNNFSFSSSALPPSTPMAGSVPIRRLAAKSVPRWMRVMWLLYDWHPQTGVCTNRRNRKACFSDSLPQVGERRSFESQLAFSHLGGWLKFSLLCCSTRLTIPASTELEILVKNFREGLLGQMFPKCWHWHNWFVALVFR